MVWERSNVDLFSLANEYFYSIRLLLPSRQAEVGPNSKSATTRETAEAQLLAYRRVHAISPNHKGREHSLPSHDQSPNASVLDNRPFDSGSGVNADSGSCSRLRIKNVIQHPATLPNSRLAEPSSPWKIPFHCSTIAMISHAFKANSAHGICYVQMVQDGNSPGHESFTAWLFSRVLGALE
jgi:hypothetical protein